MMVTLNESYEQQYSVLTADITAKIGRLKVVSEDNRAELTGEIQVNFEEAEVLLEQVELDSRGAGAGSRVAAYKAELQRIKEEYKSVLRAHYSSYTIEPEESCDDWEVASEQRRKLLDNSDKLERTGRTLTEGHRAAIEAETIGAGVLQDLSLQRETIQRARGRLRDTDEQLNRSSRLVNSMFVRALQDRFVLVVFFLVLAIVTCAGMYFYIT